MIPRTEEKQPVASFSHWYPFARSPKCKRVHGPKLLTRQNRACPPKPRGCGELYMEAGVYRKCACLRRDDEKKAARDAMLAQGPA